MRTSKSWMATLKLITLPLSLLRLLYLEAKAISTYKLRHVFKSQNRQTQKRVFNLDLHISVIEDFTDELIANSIGLTRFSISSHNHLSKFPLLAPDPVRIINDRTWRNLDSEMVSDFQNRYREYLSTFDGFIVTHTPALLELFMDFEKPILVVASTRYEAPYSAKLGQWNSLNEKIKEGVRTEQLTIIANNRGDADYLAYFTGLDVRVVPSYCGDRPEWVGSSNQRIVLARDPRLKNEIKETTSGIFQPSETLGSPYRWTELMNCLEVFVIPQNISTMTLFELATAGVPVVVPSRDLFQRLKARFSGVLDELTYTEIQNLKIDSSPDNPANYESKNYLDWWLDRSDFYDPALMPNVRVANSLDELVLPAEEVRQIREAASDRILHRNQIIRQQRSELVLEWSRSLGS